MPTFPSSILTDVLAFGGSPIANPVKISERSTELRGSTFESSAGITQSVVTHMMRPDGTFAEIGAQISAEFFLDAAQYAVLRLFTRQVGTGKNALSFDLPTTFWNPNYPSAVVSQLTSTYGIGATPFKWKFASPIEFVADPISNSNRGYYRVAITLESVLPY